MYKNEAELQVIDTGLSQDLAEMSIGVPENCIDFALLALNTASVPENCATSQEQDFLTADTHE